MSSLGKRRESDAMTLMMRDFIVELIDDKTDDFIVVLRGPSESPYKGGVWKLHVQLPDAYPYKPPLITFMNKIFHPNIHEHLGTICLNVIDKDWSPAYEFVKVFDIILPQLLLYPNPSDGLNEDAIFLLMTNKEDFEKKVKGATSEFTNTVFFMPKRRISSALVVKQKSLMRISVILKMHQVTMILKMQLQEF